MVFLHLWYQPKTSGCLKEKVQTYSIVFSHSLLKLDVTGKQTFFYLVQNTSVEDWMYVFSYLFWVGLCPHCDYADGQI